MRFDKALSKSERRSTYEAVAHISDKQERHGVRQDMILDKLNKIANCQISKCDFKVIDGVATEHEFVLGGRYLRLELEVSP